MSVDYNLTPINLLHELQYTSFAGLSYDKDSMIYSDDGLKTFGAGIECPLYSTKTGDLNGYPLLHMFFSNDFGLCLVFSLLHSVSTKPSFSAKGLKNPGTVTQLGLNIFVFIVTVKRTRSLQRH